MHVINFNSALMKITAPDPYKTGIYEWKLSSTPILRYDFLTQASFQQIHPELIKELIPGSNSGTELLISDYFFIVRNSAVLIAAFLNCLIRPTYNNDIQLAINTAFVLSYDTMHDIIGMAGLPAQWNPSVLLYVILDIISKHKMPSSKFSSTGLEENSIKVLSLGGSLIWALGRFQFERFSLCMSRVVALTICICLTIFGDWYGQSKIDAPKSNNYLLMFSRALVSQLYISRLVDSTIQKEEYILISLCILSALTLWYVIINDEVGSEQENELLIVKDLEETLATDWLEIPSSDYSDKENIMVATPMKSLASS